MCLIKVAPRREFYHSGGSLCTRHKSLQSVSQFEDSFFLFFHSLFFVIYFLWRVNLIQRRHISRIFDALGRGGGASIVSLNGWVFWLCPGCCWLWSCPGCCMAVELSMVLLAVELSMVLKYWLPLCWSGANTVRSCIMSLVGNFNNNYYELSCFKLNLKAQFLARSLGCLIPASGCLCIKFPLPTCWCDARTFACTYRVCWYSPWASWNAEQKRCICFFHCCCSIIHLYI